MYYNAYNKQYSCLNIHIPLQSSFPDPLNTQRFESFIFKKHEQSYLASGHLISHTYSGRFTYTPLLIMDNY